MSTMPSQIGEGRVVAKPALVPQPPGEKRLRAKWLKWVFLAALAVLLVLGWLAWRAHVQGAITYGTVPVERGSIQASVTATGNLNAVKNVLVSSQVSGNIKALYADWNTKVKEGQLVALIDPEIFQTQVDQASATVRSMHASVVTAEAQVEKAKSDLNAVIAAEKNAEAIVAKDLANELNAKIQWERADSLFRVGVISEQDHDSAKATYDACRAQVEADKSEVAAAKQSIQSAEAQVRVTQNQLASAQAQQRQAQAALQQAQTNLIHTRILAPVDGTVIARRMDVGQTVASSLNPPTIFEIAQDLTKMQVDTNVDESDIGNVSIGQKANFTVDSYPDTTFHGVVADVRKAPIITQNVVTYDVVITVDNSDLRLLPGMTANVTILTAKMEDTLKVPNAVLRFHPSSALLKQTGVGAAQPGKPQIYILEGKNLTTVAVGVGFSDGKYTAVKSTSLHAGQRAVVRATVGTASTASSPTRPMPTGPRM